jgi:hypothetical protein
MLMLLMMKIMPLRPLPYSRRGFQRVEFAPVLGATVTNAWQCCWSSCSGCTSAWSYRVLHDCLLPHPAF